MRLGCPRCGQVLDVIEGLEEAHRCGVLHRDVKPSNCFLDADGRVKVGDFGLAKSLLQDAGLTGTGAFLGTILFAAPEQMRKDPVDHRADVYAVAATLYFLLTGRAPFQAEDAAATVARTLSDPPTPMRRLRPGLPRTLDEVVLRGLARSPQRRWQSLEEFRLALLPFVPEPNTPGEVGWRCGAYVCDALALVVLETSLLQGAGHLAGTPVGRPPALLWFALTLGLGLLYFALPESLWGWSPGKYLFRLRVRTASTGDRPGLGRAGWRTSCFYAVKDGLALVVLMLLPPLLGGALSPPTRPGVPFGAAAALAASLLLARGAGLGLMACPMRRRNGYRGLHDFLSGTRVIRLPAAQPSRVPQGRPPEARQAPPDGLPTRLGAFAVRALLRRDGDDAVLLGEDGVLGRRVRLWLRPAGQGLPPGRHEVSRATRPRWLGGGQEGQGHWDAFVASPGWALPELVGGRGRLLWPETLPLLEQLAEELDAACKGGTVPRVLGVGQVWVQPGGRLQLLDTPLHGEPAGAAVVGQETPGGDDQARALTLLRQTATLALEGRPRPAGAPATPLRAPVPRQGAHLLGLLVGGPRTAATVGEFRAALQAGRERPAGVSPTRRRLHLAALALVLALGLCWMLGTGPVLDWVAYLAPVEAESAGEVAREELDRVIGQDVAAVAGARGPVSGLPALAQFADDLRARDRLGQRLGQVHRQRQPGLGSSSWFTRQILEWAEGQSRPVLLQDWRTRAAQQAARGGSAREFVREAQQRLDEVSALTAEADDYWVAVALAALWPALWVLWAAATRGGYTLRLLGIALVQADGRRASRLRCGWRAFLVWTPVALLLTASLWLDTWRLSGTAQGPDGQAAAAWLAWLALGLLPLYGWLAQRSPDRGLHDRLAGTYLVPR